MTPRRALFVYTKNAARSQMAEGLVRPFAGDRFDVASAGIERASVHPFAIRVMAEIGIVRAVAKASRIESDALELSSEGIVDRQDGITRFTEIVLRPRLTIPLGADRDRAARRSR